ncbi:hypothetical protein ASE74_04130 [Pedobacter sp. Leaf216]|uniref:conjugative transposon protein TraM n=1 Tax=Pedobacter sp. Leaf216 TaxID=1735684 RepID=UPI0006FFE78E|nr:conjugative transposon protein TraM [Pedobacter sp. Leaf216]KQM69208.1 hypothetical protein ASE74_04130 [Pedobacter sp. Leaf216]
MKKINLKSPRYVIPLICLPFILIFYSIYRNGAASGQADHKASADSLRSDVAGVSAQIQAEKLQDKLAAFQQRYRKGDGYTAVGSLADEQQDSPLSISDYSEKEKHMLDSIESLVKSRYAGYPGSPKAPARAQGSALRSNSSASSGLSQDRALAAALEEMRKPLHRAPAPEKADQGDAMAVFKAQMAIVDSIGKANDPAYRSQLLEQKKRAAKDSSSPQIKPLSVSLDKPEGNAFNTVRAAEAKAVYIPAMLDQEITGYSGSRVRLRLLENIRAGDRTIEKGSHLYGTVSSFSSQRIQITVSSLLSSAGILPVHLELYDLDGLKGLYVPSSAFRELTRELGSSPLQGISADGQGEENKQLMSILGRVFQSSSGALTRLVRQNKAKIKYATMVYLIDPAQLSTINKPNTF